MKNILFVVVLLCSYVIGMLVGSSDLFKLYEYRKKALEEHYAEQTSELESYKKYSKESQDHMLFWWRHCGK